MFLFALIIAMMLINLYSYNILSGAFSNEYAKANYFWFVGVLYVLAHIRIMWRELNMPAELRMAIKTEGAKSDHIYDWLFTPSSILSEDKFAAQSVQVYFLAGLCYLIGLLLSVYSGLFKYYISYIAASMAMTSFGIFFSAPLVIFILGLAVTIKNVQVR